MNEYDQLVKIYDYWCLADPSAYEALRFYTELCAEAAGDVVELGVGSGRIALEIAKLGKPVTGIDISEAMLNKCRSRANARGLSHLIQLMQSDIRTFSLAEPARLIILPYRTVGHLLTDEDRLTAFRRIYQQMAPGGRFVFDHFVIHDIAPGADVYGMPRLACKILDETTGGHTYVWYTNLYNPASQLMECTITLEQTDSDGIVIQRQHFPLTLCWIEPGQLRKLLLLAGFQIEALYGSFSKDPFDDAANEQIWIARRPA